MRIRKRQAPLPFSSLSPLISDPPPPVQLQLPPSDLHLAAYRTNALEKEMEELDDDTRETSVCGAETSNGVVLSLTTTTSSSPQVVGRWCEREKAFPLKKRRGSFEKPIDQDEDDQITTMKTKKYCTLPQKQEDQSKLAGPDLPGKKKSRGGALMEGSRCSRVNGRGWRCCQQTLVGYSLCEHHLGKGRLRSMNSVRSRSLAASKTVIIAIDGEDEKKSSPSPSPSLSLSPPPPPPPPRPSLMLTSKKRTKLGVVKARSISSLLGQTDNVMAAVAARPLPPPSHDDNKAARPSPPPSLDDNIDE